jgi:phage/plasmid-associated DNA primase
MQLYEPLPRPALRWMKDEIRRQLPESKLPQALGLINKSLDGYDEVKKVVNVNYTRHVYRGEVLGRAFADAGMQGMPRCVRGAFATMASLHDIDAVACQPTLLSQFCAKHDVDAPVLNAYIQNREAALEAVMMKAGCTREDAKDAFNAATFLCSLRYFYTKFNCEHIDLLENYADEMHRITISLIKIIPDIYEAVKEEPHKHLGKNPDARFVALLVQTLEHDCLMAAVAFIQAAGIDVVTLCFDGALISSGDVDLDRLADHVHSTTGFRLQWKFKPHETNIAVPDSVANSPDMTADVANMWAEAKNEKIDYLAKVFLALNPGFGRYVNRTWYLFNGVYYDQADDQSRLRPRISSALIPFLKADMDSLAAEIKAANQEAEDPDADTRAIGRRIKKLENSLAKLGKLDVKLNRPKFVDEIISSLQGLCFATSEWIDALGSNFHLLGFEDGVFDCSINQFRKATPDDMMVRSVQKKIADVQIERPDKRQFINNLIETYMCGDADKIAYLKALLGSIVHGGNKRQKINIWGSAGRSGRGTIMAMVNKALGSFNTTFDMAVFAQRGISRSNTGPNTTIEKLKFAYSGFTDEPETGDRLAVGILKKLSGLSPMTTRGMWGKADYEFVSPTKVFLICNEKPPFEDRSRGMFDRVELLMWMYYVSPEERDPHFDRLVGDSHVHCQLLRMMLEWWSETGFDFETPPSIVKESRDYCITNDPLARFIDDNFERAPEGKISISHLVDDFMKHDDEAKEFYYNTCNRNKSQLGEMLKVKGHEVRRSNQNQLYLFGLKPKQNAPMFIDDYEDYDDL